MKPSTAAEGFLSIFFFILITGVVKQLTSLLPYLNRYRTSLLWGGVFLLATNFFLVSAPRFVAQSVDLLGATPFDAPSLTQPIILGIFFSLGAGFFLFLVRQTIIVVSRKIEFDLKNDLYAHLQRLDYLYFKSMSTGDIMSRATNDLNAVRNFLGPGIMYSTNTLFRLIFALSAMLALSPMLTLYVMLPAPLISFLVYYIGKKIHSQSQAIQEHYGLITSKVQENLSGIRIVKAFTREQAEEDMFRDLNEGYYTKNLNLAKLQAVFYPSITALIGISIMLVIWIGGQEVISGKISLGTIVQFLIYVLSLSWPLISIGWVTNIIQRAAASQARIDAIFSLTPKVKDTPLTDAAITHLNGNITFDRVGFAYPSAPDRMILKEVSFSIRAGERVAIVGATGAGKSTLVQLLPRFLEPSYGTITVDGHSIEAIPLTTLRRSIGFVPQDYFLFSDTLRQNIAFGAQSPAELSDDDMIRVTKAAALYEDIERFSDRFDTMLGERGITLSGGQKQRTAIARALLTKPSILIMDDSLSAVDTKTEDTILHSLFSSRESTVILISHRISTVKNCDTILVLHEGYIVESGTHEELLRRDGYYANLHRRQQLEDEISTLS